MTAQSPVRKIIHIDMDAFFAAVEQRDHPHYRNLPLIVGGMPDSRGVVATCSYEARKFGIHSAMSSSQAYRLCPQAVFVKPRFDVYREVSKTIHQIFSQFSDHIEPLSLDEAYLDVSGEKSATLIAKSIKEKIVRQTGLTASAGVSYNKFLAKIASDINKPDGFFLIRPERGKDFISQLPISRFHGVGRATEKKMHALGIRTGKDLQCWTLAKLCQHFGKSGVYYYHLVRGIDERPVISHRPRKSVGVETTFEEDISGYTLVKQYLQKLLAQALKKMADKKLIAHTVTIKIKYQNFVQITRSKTLSSRITKTKGLDQVFEQLLKNTDVDRRKIRLLGIILSSLNKVDAAEFRQLDLFNLLEQTSDFSIK